MGYQSVRVIARMFLKWVVVAYYRRDTERMARTYKSEAHQDEEKGDGVRCFSHRGQCSQAVRAVSRHLNRLPTFISRMTSAGYVAHAHTTLILSNIIS